MEELETPNKEKGRRKKKTRKKRGGENQKE